MWRSKPRKRKQRTVWRAPGHFVPAGFATSDDTTATVMNIRRYRTAAAPSPDSHFGAEANGGSSTVPPRQVSFPCTAQSATNRTPLFIAEH